MDFIKRLYDPQTKIDGEMALAVGTTTFFAGLFLIPFPFSMLFYFAGGWMIGGFWNTRSR